eukprot:gene1912-468_t
MNARQGDVPTHVDSTITKVTVFADRAHVCRTSTPVFFPEAGEYTCVFEGLPECTDAQSIQVSGAGQMAVLKSVQMKTELLIESNDQQLAEIEKEMDSIRAQTITFYHLVSIALWILLCVVKNPGASQVAPLDDEMNNLNKQFIQHCGLSTASGCSKADFLSNILESPEPSRRTGDNDPRLSVDDYSKLFTFFGSSFPDIQKRQREVNDQRKDLQATLKKLQHEKAALGRGGHSQPSKHNVHVLLQALEKGQTQLNLVYMVTAGTASWSAMYDLRVNSGARQVSVEYHAKVMQSSGEDWKDVVLELSTAKPMLGGKQPELTPWRLSVAAPRVQRELMPRMRNQLAPMAQAFEPPQMAQQMFTTNMFMGGGADVDVDVDADEAMAVVSANGI